MPSVLELRVAVTTRDYERLMRFYRDGLGLEPDELWTDAADRAAIFGLGQATVELFDEAHAAVVDGIEAGAPTGAAIRFALRVPDLEAALARALANGATLAHSPVVTPWRHHNVRVQDPDGLQITLFQVLDDA